MVVNPPTDSHMYHPKWEHHQKMANAIRFLAMDAVEAAASGHPGMPMGMADVATVLFQKFMKFSPQHPNWIDRDRFVLSAGHGSMLQYALLYLLGYPEMDVDQLRQFRQLHSKTPGHPEYGHTIGVETTTGPLGQGFANAVGMAMAEEKLRARWGHDVIDHFTYVIAGDGCLMEGISHEAASLAGHLKLQKLIVLFDDNHITIDGPTSLSTSDNHCLRFESYGWDVIRIDGHHPDHIEHALHWARKSTRPSLIACRTTIAYGAPNKAGTSAAHGSPLGPNEIEQARVALGWNDPPFVIPGDVLESWRQVGKAGNQAYGVWYEKNRLYHQQIETAAKGDLSLDLNKLAVSLKQQYNESSKPEATRVSCKKFVTAVYPEMPELIGGSADLTGSNGTLGEGMQPISARHWDGQYVYYGVREHAMAAAMNGLALHGGMVPYGGTFLSFADYCRPAIRLAALMRIRSIFIMTHDSIGLGEDGPTHQPVEHLASLRVIPHLHVIRPADGIETVEAWQIALESKKNPSVLVLTRQNLPPLRTSAAELNPDINWVKKGAYTLSPCPAVFKHTDPKNEVILMASGSEVQLAMGVQQKLTSENIASRVVSFPCWSLFDAQSSDYKQSVLGASVFRVGIEAGRSMGWERYLGEQGLFFGVEDFGASAPYEVLYEWFGLTVDRIYQSLLSQWREKLKVS